MPPITNHNEKELLQKIAEGDQSSYKILFDNYWDRMYTNALHFTKSPETAQDLAQEIFIKIWLMRSRLKEVERFDAFLFTVAKNMIVDELRRLHASPKNDDFFNAYFQPAEDNIIKKAELKDLEKVLNEAIDQLPAQMQMAFKLSRFEGLTHEQIAQRMNISRVTSQNYIARAIVAIKKYLAGRDITISTLALIFFYC